MLALQCRACTEDSRMLGGLSDHLPAVDSENPALDREGVGL
jgi:hypothetical protein